MIICSSFLVKFFLFLLRFFMGSWSSVLKLSFCSVINHFLRYFVYFDLSIITTPQPLFCSIIRIFWSLESSLTACWYLCGTFILVYFLHVLRNFVFNVNKPSSGILDMSLRSPWWNRIQHQYQFYLNLVECAAVIHMKALFLHHVLKHRMINYVLSV